MAKDDESKRREFARAVVWDRPILIPEFGIAIHFERAHSKQFDAIVVARELSPAECAGNRKGLTRRRRRE